jgi:hypothetical protein
MTSQHHSPTVDRRASKRRDPTAGRAARLVESVGGRYSTQLGIDLDSGAAAVERWFLAATLYGNRIAAHTAERTYRELVGAGLTRARDMRRVSWDHLVLLLDAGGYTRYDFQTATRLQDLAQRIDELYGGRVGDIPRRAADPEGIAAELDALPGWGPVTVGVFLREMRGVWPGVDPPLDKRAAAAARHLGLISRERGRPALDRVRDIARVAGLDFRDLEAALVRLALSHRGNFTACPGRDRCSALGGGRGSAEAV